MKFHDRIDAAKRLAKAFGAAQQELEGAKT